MLYDCHTYKDAVDNDVVRIINCRNNQQLNLNTLYSAGIHPWHVAESSFRSTEFEIIEQLANLNNVVAIGECGLDKLHANMELQKTIFQMHIDLANKTRKPLIVHCVKAFSLIYELLKNTTVPIITHGVNNQIDKLKPLMELGCYFSFGEALLKSKSIARETFLHIPNDRILLETDESSVSIGEIYQQAAILKDMSSEKITLQVANNFKRVFG